MKPPSQIGHENSEVRGDCRCTVLGLGSRFVGEAGGVGSCAVAGAVGGVTVAFAAPYVRASLPIAWADATEARGLGEAVGYAIFLVEPNAFVAAGRDVGPVVEAVAVAASPGVDVDGGAAGGFAVSFKGCGAVANGASCDVAAATTNPSVVAGVGVDFAEVVLCADVIAATVDVSKEWNGRGE